jgi:hypothetical protein
MDRLLSRLSIAGRLMQYLWQERLWWMIPLVLILLGCGALIVFSHSAAVTPFIYTLF